MKLIVVSLLLSKAVFAGEVTATQISQIKTACEKNVLTEEKCLAKFKEFKTRIKSKRAEMDIMDSTLDKLINEINEGK
jgi:hypothetical protein